MSAAGERRRTALLAVVVFALALVGCGDRDDGGDVVSIDAVAETTLEQSSARVRMVFELEDGDELAMEGVLDFRDQRARLEVELFGVTDLYLVTDDGAFIGLMEPPDAGPRWLHLDTSSEDLDEDEVLPDPSALVSQILDAASGVDSIGEGEVRGEPTRSYHLRIDAPGDGADRLGMSVSGPATGTLDVDANGRLRRLVMETEDPGIDEDALADGPAFITKRGELELWDFGVDVDVETPPGSDVVDVESPAGLELMSRLYGGTFDGE